MQRPMPHRSRNTVRLQDMGRTFVCGASLLVLSGMVIVGGANATEIADTPLITSPNVQAKPNLMFVLDDSGSMANDYMPDAMKDDDKYGFWSSQCNGVAYNPTFTYTPPIKANGTSSYADSSFGAAWSDGYAGTGSVNLGAASTVTTRRTSASSVAIGSGSKTFSIRSSSDTNTFVVGGTITASNSDSRWMVGTVTSWTGSGSNWTLVINVPTGQSSGSSTRDDWDISQDVQVGTRYYYQYTATSPQTAMSWSFGSTGSVNTTTTFYKECMSDIGASPGNGVFQKVLILDQSAAQKQNYANWYSYYRTRTLLMRTAVGRAFAALDSGYRVGFSTINSSTDATTSDGFQPLADFDQTQKNVLYSKLYGASASGATPLRGALSKIGRYYANLPLGQTKDPVQYACQRNFVLLSTDGYWNKGSGNSEESNSGYGPLDLSGNPVGNWDGTESRPMHDGATPVTIWQRTRYTVTKGSRFGTCSSSSLYKVTSQVQTSTSQNGTYSNSGDPVDGGCVAGTTVIVDTTASALAGNGTATKDTVATSSQSTSGGSSNSLADVAEYYYKTDLRDEQRDGTTKCTSTASGTSQNVCGNLVPTSGRDTAKYQHMTTFTIGLGVSGTLTYDRNYLTQPSGSYVDLISGDASWPAPITNLADISGSSGDARNVDDLWHAAVNGRGQYYSALNAAQLAEAISGVVDTIAEVTGSSSAATTSTLELVSGDDNQVYSASYTTGSWVGDLKAFPLDGDTGEIGTTATWSAQAKLSATAYTSRNIYYLKPNAATATLADFNWTNLNADGLGSNFTDVCPALPAVAKLSQCTNLNADEKGWANDGTRLVNFLRGDKSNQAANTTLGSTQALFRARAGLLGDIINGAPRYVSKPAFSYSDAGYTDFVQTWKDRKAMLYVASNDGMLHAISAGGTDGGTELWAYVPTAVMKNMYRLADSSYESKHRYFVDGAPVVGDIYVNGAWKTILVGGLGKGGRSYYALDITDPQAPKALWEFTDNNLGLTFGNPVITKRANGTWVVVFASGYNNDGSIGDGSTGDGQGRLFVLNANTGVRARTDITTGVGATNASSGLAKINGWIDQDIDNTSKRFYGGDLLGNLWRFDIDGVVAPNNAALALAKFQINATTPQPITTRPRLGESNGKPVIIVGTGQYLGTGDISNTTTQTIYAVKDSLTNTSLGDVRANNTMVRQTLSVNQDGITASITNNQVSWTANNGWWVDLPQSGERSVVDIALQSNVLAIATAIPAGDACSSGGSSWNYFLSVSGGTALQNVAGAQVSANALVVGQSFVRMADGTMRLIRQLSDSTTKLVDTPSGAPSPVTPQRTSWRELVD
ncbi:PilC/PilY family type IV pilus protein [Variovorax robiniae]|uniref:PilC/PilY family type IV pilus protein n=1 Tax=Variovorax robiniae TaxID=1836199 RepID=A0ABU8XFF4_9BURK